MLKGSCRVREGKFGPLGVLQLDGHKLSALLGSICRRFVVLLYQRLALATAAPSVLAFLLLLARNLLGSRLCYLTNDD